MATTITPLGRLKTTALPHFRRPPPSSPASLRPISLSSSFSSPSIGNIVLRCNSGAFLLNHSNRKRRFELKAVDSGVTGHNPESNESFKQWDWWTGKFAAAANLPFLLLQLPQIILNTRNLLAGDKSALFAVPWLSILTGMLGNLSLLSYFVKKKESEAAVVQTLGAISMYIVITQLAMAGSMPLPFFAITSAVVGVGLLSNCLKYFGMLPPSLWRSWEDFTTIGGFSVLPQVMWSTFAPYIPDSILPGSIAFVIAVTAVIMARTGKLSEKGINFVGSISGWTATLLFMWMPIAQFWTNFLNPDNIQGLSSISMLLAMIGNGLLIPRAFFIRDAMWLLGASWGTILYGWGNLLCLYWFNSISKEFFLATTCSLLLWLGMTFWKDKQVRG